MVLEAVGLTREFSGPPLVRALEDGTLGVAKGEQVAITGPSGAGKSTLMNILGLLDVPSAGSYTLLGEDTTRMTSGARDRLRSRAIGFVFQAYHVLAHRTVRENVALKLAIVGVPRGERADMVDRTVDSVGLSHRRDALARDLSGGEKQRLALARALVWGPRLLLADEPTGNLDPGNAGVILDLFDELARSGMSVVTITHDERVAARADRVLVMAEGVVRVIT